MNDYDGQARVDCPPSPSESNLETQPSRLLQSLFENLIAAFAPPQAVFSEGEAAKYLKTTVESVQYYALRKNLLAYHSVGRNRVYTKKDLDAFLASRRVMGIEG